MIVDLTYETPKTQKLKNISKYEQQAKDNLQLIAKETETLSDRPSTYNILTDYYNHLISYYANNPTLLDAFFLYQYSDTMITIFDTLNKKIFKGGFLKVPLKDNPSKGEEEMIDHLLSNSNENNEDLKEVFEQVEVAGNWSNLRTLLLLKEYKRVNNEWKTKTVKQIMHIDPLTIEPIKDKTGRMGYDKTGQKIYFSLNKRDAWTYKDKTDGKPNMQADYRVLTDTGFMYYNRTELLVKKKFPANPMFALKNKILSMIAQDKHIMNEYSEGKSTKKMLIFKGKNLEEVKGSLKEYSNAVREKPNKMHPLMMGGVDGNQQMTEVVDLVRSLEEMQATEFRNEYRNAMGAPYGVQPIFNNDASSGGALNDDKGSQLIVTNESIESNKDDYNYLLKQIFNVTLGITDWEVRLLPNEEEDEAKKEELLTKKLANAEKLLNMGGKVKFIPDNKDGQYELIYEKGELEKKEQTNPSIPQVGEQKKSKDVEKESKNTALEITMDEYNKEFTKLVKDVIDKV